MRSGGGGLQLAPGHTSVSFSQQSPSASRERVVMTDHAPASGAVDEGATTGALRASSGGQGTVVGAGGAQVANGGQDQAPR
jgi:hypothetical protein